LRDLLLEIAADLDCTILRLPSCGLSVTIAMGGIDEASFHAVRDAFCAELADSIIPHPVEFVHLDSADDHILRTAAKGGIPWKLAPLEPRLH